MDSEREDETMQTLSSGMAMNHGHDIGRWLPPELINTVWEFFADPGCQRGASLHGQRFPAEAAPTAGEIGCCGGKCRCGYRIVC
ncbi:MAG: hypothetical protein KDJ14_02325 [Xanthomonadales bacterium]|nr:hypothetical protein [Xanthomonadales bacterium]